MCAEGGGEEHGQEGVRVQAGKADPSPLLCGGRPPAGLC